MPPNANTNAIPNPRLRNHETRTNAIPTSATPVSPVRWSSLTCVNLLHVRQRQPDLVPIHDRVVCLQRIALEVDSVQVLLIRQLPLDFLERRQLIRRCPHLFQEPEGLEIRQVGDLIVGDVEHAEIGGLVETGDGGQCVVRDVKFFEVGEVFQALDLGEAVGLNGENLEIGEG